LTNQGNQTVKEIADAINNAKTVKAKLVALAKATNVNLSETNNGTSIIGVTVTSKPDGTLNININTNTQNASNPTQAVAGSLKGESDATLAQPKNIKTIEDLFNNAKLIKQGNRKIADIVSSMNKGLLADKLKAIKDETGIDVPLSKDGTTITGIVITENVDGEIGVEIKTETKGAKTPKHVSDVTIDGDKNAVVDARIAKAKADIDQPDNINAIQKALDKAKLTNQGNQTVKEIADAINNAKTVKAKLVALAKATNVNLSETNNGTSI
ncbi:MAG: hypothetical protein GY800_13055, partial [Planctomycetes bacterium]|nr:hypothetical protein [Planctomycetota bacterium]